ncbi:MAG: tRNA pseudouridine(38-40) synthase TruA [Verrucomicrobia bacterium]|nr:tRNA pseudouridine(38-40) synthase TruA [Verrucomicrobiota bacterium]
MTVDGCGAGLTRYLITMKNLRVEVVRFKLVIALDGAAFHGWQSGRSGRGAADHLEAALARYFPGASGVVSSSRTDSGVHAVGLVAHVDLPRAVAPDRVRAALNAVLPATLRVMAASRVSSAFHARFDAVSKEYRYQIRNHPVMDPLLVGRAWHVPQALDLPAMRAAAACLVGVHDFRSFTVRRDGSPGETTRKILRCGIRGRRGLLTLVGEADGFLYRMCRRIAGTLVDVGRGRMTVDDVVAALDRPGIAAAGVTAPAHGLCLHRVRYQRSARD